MSFRGWVIHRAGRRVCRVAVGTSRRGGSFRQRRCRDTAIRSWPQSGEWLAGSGFRLPRINADGDAVLSRLDVLVPPGGDNERLAGAMRSRGLPGNTLYPAIHNRFGGPRRNLPGAREIERRSLNLWLDAPWPTIDASIDMLLGA